MAYMIMKLINRAFDIRRIDDRIFDKKSKVRKARPKFVSIYNHDTDALMECVDFEDAEICTERLLGHAYKDEINCQPRKQSMRKRYAGKKMMVDWWDERPGGSGNYEWHNFHNRLYGLVDKYVGKKFDDCFAALKERYMTNKDWRRQACGLGNRKAKRNNLWMGIYHHFLGIFETDPKAGDYYVEDGIICKMPSKPRHPARDIHQYEGELYYVPNFGAIRCQSSQLADARINIAELNLPEKCTHEFVQRWESSFRTLGYWQVRRLAESCFTRVDNRTIKVIKYHSREWWALKGRKAKRKSRYNAAYYDRSLWVQNYLKNNPEIGFTFHTLMENNPEDIRRSRFIEAANRIITNPCGYYAQNYNTRLFIQTLCDVMRSTELDKLCSDWVLDAEMALRNIVVNKIKNNDLQRANTEETGVQS